MAKKHCCNTMKEKVEFTCYVHVFPFDCPDYVIHYFEKRDEYGLVIHNGKMSTIPMFFCPWCGSELPALSQEKTDN